MSDGLPEDGPHEGGDYIEPIVALADEIKADDVIIYSLGFFHDDMSGEELESANSLIERIASDNFHFNITDINDLQMVFDSMAKESSGDNAVVISVECPVDVTVKYNGEVLSSDPEMFNTATSFGIMTFDGENQETKILRLDRDHEYEIVITGTGTGKMNYSISYPDKQGEYKDVRRVKGIPIKRDTYISTVANMKDAQKKTSLSAPKLNIDEDGDGKYETVYVLDKGKKHKTFGGMLASLILRVCLITLGVIFLIYVIKVILRIKKRNTCSCGAPIGKDSDFCPYCGRKKKDIGYVLLGDYEQKKGSAFAIAFSVTLSVLLCVFSIVCWKFYQSVPNSILREYKQAHYDTAVELYDRGIETSFDEKYMRFIFDKNIGFNGGYDSLSEEQEDCLAEMDLL